MSILHKIVSGGQTGVDRAALDVALALGIDAGGWCPDGRLAEDGRIPGRYPVPAAPRLGLPAAYNLPVLRAIMSESVPAI